MLKEGRDLTVHFLTREAADEEKHILEERLEKAKEALKQKDAVIKEVIKDKDARIAALNEQCTWAKL
jgi:anaerobic ribonucleoside-triphosphate reductase